MSCFAFVVFMLFFVFCFLLFAFLLFFFCFFPRLLVYRTLHVPVDRLDGKAAAGERLVAHGLLARLFQARRLARRRESLKVDLDVARGQGLVLGLCVWFALRLTRQNNPFPLMCTSSPRYDMLSPRTMYRPSGRSAHCFSKNSRSVVSWMIMLAVLRAKLVQATRRNRVRTKLVVRA